jgi:hypothetical protein
MKAVYCDVCGKYLGDDYHYRHPISEYCDGCVSLIHLEMDRLGWDGQELFREAYREVAIKKLKQIDAPTPGGWPAEVLMHKVELLGNIVAKLTKVIKV